MRPSLDCSTLNEPRVIAGVEWKLVVLVMFFFGMAALMFHIPGVMVIPFVMLVFLRGPGKNDSAFLRVYLRHRAQRARYSPAYITEKNQSNPRPTGFHRLTMT